MAKNWFGILIIAAVAALIVVTVQKYNAQNSSATATTSGFVGEIFHWLQQPFNSSGSAFNWILFVGLIAIAMFLWQTVLLQLRNEI
jgi:hypothetical protein